MTASIESPPGHWGSDCHLSSRDGQVHIASFSWKPFAQAMGQHRDLLPAANCTGNKILLATTSSPFATWVSEFVLELRRSAQSPVASAEINSFSKKIVLEFNSWVWYSLKSVLSSDASMYSIACKWKHVRNTQNIGNSQADNPLQGT